MWTLVDNSVYNYLTLDTEYAAFEATGLVKIAHLRCNWLTHFYNLLHVSVISDNFQVTYWDP